MSNIGVTMREGWVPRLLAVMAAIGTTGALAAGPAVSAPAHAAAPPQTTAPRISAGCQAAAGRAAFYAPGPGRTVALTFDDGPGGTTAGVISVLRSMGVTATFFNIGENEAARPQTVMTEARMGYLIGNHTWDHADLSTLPGAAQARPPARLAPRNAAGSQRDRHRRGVAAKNSALRPYRRAAGRGPGWREGG